MKNEPPMQPAANDPLDNLLRGADEYLPDQGFTARVLKALPAKRSHSWRRLVILSTALLLSGGLLAWQWPAAVSLLEFRPDPAQGFQWHALLMTLPLLAAAATLVWVMFAIIGEEE